MRIQAAARELARTRGQRHLPVRYSFVPEEVYRPRFLPTRLPTGASFWFHFFDGSWWLGKISQPTDTHERYVVRFLDKPGPVMADLRASAYITRLQSPCGSWCLQTHGRTNLFRGVLHG